MLIFQEHIFHDNPIEKDHIHRFNRKIGFYTRYEEVNAARDQDKFNQWELGLNWWPQENVVIKFDYRDRRHDLENSYGRNFTGIDLGLGYSF